MEHEGIDTTPGKLEDLRRRVGYLEFGMAENTAMTRAVAQKMDEHYTLLVDLKEEKAAKRWLGAKIGATGKIAAAATAISAAVAGAYQWLKG